MNTTVKKAIQLEAEFKYEEARQLIQGALAKNPTDKDLLCEELILGCFNWEERVAADRFNEISGATREKVLFGILSNHFSAVKAMYSKLGKSDSDLDAYLAKFPLGDKEGVGVNLSACLIVKNESQFLAQCLESVKGIVDEIVVVDTGSTDDTVAIAESFGAKIAHFEWCNDFSAARNVSLNEATGQWALWIDADEALDARSVEMIRQAIVRPHFGGYNLEIVNFVADDKPEEQFVHRLLRLFQRREGVKFVEPIHEQIAPSLKTLGLPWMHLPEARLWHYGYKHEVMESKGKIERTLAILEARLNENPNDPFQWFNLANTHIVAKNYEQAAAAAEKTVSMMAPTDEFAPLAYQVWMTSLCELGNPLAAAEVADLARERGTESILIEFESANALAKLGNWERALEAIQRSLSMEWPIHLAGDRSIEAFKRHALQGQILARLGRTEEALESMDFAVQNAPNHTSLQLARGVLFRHLGRDEEARADFNAVADDPHFGFEARLHLGQLEAKRYNFKAAADIFRSAWLLDTQSADAWSYWCEALEASNDDLALLRAYEELFEHRAPDSKLLTNYGRALERAGQIEEAIECFARAIQTDEEDANAYFNGGDVLYRIGRYEDAVNWYQNGLKLAPEHASGWFVFGNALAQLNYTEAAVRCYDEVLRIDPHHAGAKYNRSVVAA
jgi:tetratricopeptide (TPR) repeat protein